MMVDVLCMHFKIQKSYSSMGNICFDIRKRCVWMLDLLYLCFNFRDINLRMVDIWDTRFGTQKDV